MHRRTLLAGGLAALVAGRVRADAGSLGALVERSGLGGVSAFAVADLITGEILEAHQPEAAMPPASVTKVATTLYALGTLGPAYRFRTRLVARGPVRDGRLGGDLALVGGGDPVLDTDDLAAMLRALRAAGTKSVDGRLLIADGALPSVPLIEAGQPDEAAYNPPVSGLNLNFNRVYLGWAPGQGGPKLRFSARGAGADPEIGRFGAQMADGGPPRHRMAGGREMWTLARGGLKGNGSVWLPVRDPAAYAAAVFRALAKDSGVTLPEAVEVTPEVEGPVAVEHASPPLDTLMRDMLRYSTNLTAEVAGLRASQARGLDPTGLGVSAAAMTAWVRETYGLTSAVFTTHSGLPDTSRIAPAEMVALLRGAADGPLPGLLRERPILDRGGAPEEAKGVRAVAKTGTLDFVSALAGYMAPSDGTGRRLAFAIFAADPERRAAIRPEQRSAPPGTKAWLNRARGLERALLQRWAVAYAR